MLDANPMPLPLFKCYGFVFLRYLVTVASGSIYLLFPVPSTYVVLKVLHVVAY